MLFTIKGIPDHVLFAYNGNPQSIEKNTLHYNLTLHLSLTSRFLSRALGKRMHLCFRAVRPSVGETVRQPEPGTTSWLNPQAAAWSLRLYHDEQI